MADSSTDFQRKMMPLDHLIGPSDPTEGVKSQGMPCPAICLQPTTPPCLCELPQCSCELVPFFVYQYPSSLMPATASDLETTYAHGEGTLSKHGGCRHGAAH